jgi:mannose-6-phosphate isomerase-like protein (cupin superfamily)
MSEGRVVQPRDGWTFPYAGQPMRVIAELAGFAIAEMTVPAGFAGPVPHRHDGFDEAIYVLDGTLLLTYGHDDPVEAPAGSMCVAPRGVRHTFGNPNDRPARVLGLWSPGSAGIAFMTEIGAALPSEGRPDPAMIAEIYRRHASELMP